MSKSENPMTTAARKYVARGWRVLPLHSVTGTGGCTCGNAACGSVGKHPRTAHGAQDATKSEALARVWWDEEYPMANIGIATGRASGLVVLDIDPRHGGTLAALGELPATKRVRTGVGGWHLYFAYPADGLMLEMRNSAGTLAPGVDVRGEGGYVVAPPSLHASGRRYEGDGTKVEIAELPPELIKRLATTDSIVAWMHARHHSPQMPQLSLMRAPASPAPQLAPAGTFTPGGGVAARPGQPGGTVAGHPQGIAPTCPGPLEATTGAHLLHPLFTRH